MTGPGLYIPSKGRFDYMITSKALTEMKVPHYVVVESQERDQYLAAVRKFGLSARVLVLDESYKDRYDHCDKLGRTKSSGPGPARNFAWDHSISQSHSHHWVMDDNIRNFLRLHSNRKIKVVSSVFWRLMESWGSRYTNLAMCGPNYRFFCVPGKNTPPVVFNTRIYSCNLIRNDVPFRWRGRYNEDTILSLDMLTNGWCTAQFNAFLQDKINTQVIPGGNTAEFYAAEGTSPKSEMLVNVYPQYARRALRFGREHHFVDYTPFKKLSLNRRPGPVQVPADMVQKVIK